MLNQEVLPLTDKQALGILAGGVVGIFAFRWYRGWKDTVDELITLYNESVNVLNWVAEEGVDLPKDEFREKFMEKHIFLNLMLRETEEKTVDQPS